MNEQKDLQPLTVYIPKQVMSDIDTRRFILGRSKNQEILYLIRLGLSVSEKADSTVLSLLSQHPPK